MDNREVSKNANDKNSNKNCWYDRCESKGKQMFLCAL